MKSILRVVAIAGAIATAASPALAQSGTSSSRAFRGLFASPSGQPARATGQTLNLTFDVAEAYDDDVLATSGPINPSTPALDGFYSMFTAAADYAHQGRSVRVGLNALSTLRYYQDLNTVQNSSSSIGAGFSATLPGRVTWLVNQTVSYSPSYLYAVFPGLATDAPGELPTSAAPNYAVNDVASYSYGTNTAFSHGLTRRGTLLLSADVTKTDFVHQVEGRADMLAYGVRVEFLRNVQRRTAARFGYHFRGGDSGFALGASTVEHGLDVGVQTERLLSATRKATFSITLGPSMVRIPALAVGTAPLTPELGDAQLYRVSGSAAASYQFGRSWEAKGSYSRGLEYVPGLRTPVLTGGISAVVDGLLSRRVDLNVSASYSDGSSALRTASSYTTYTGNARLRFAVTRHWAVYTEYLYYYYDFRGTALLPGLPSALERNGARVGLTLWLPVIER